VLWLLSFIPYFKRGIRVLPFLLTVSAAKSSSKFLEEDLHKIPPQKKNQFLLDNKGKKVYLFWKPFQESA
jgi:hypothetical protein